MYACKGKILPCSRKEEMIGARLGTVVCNRCVTSRVIPPTVISRAGDTNGRANTQETAT